MDALCAALPEEQRRSLQDDLVGLLEAQAQRIREKVEQDENFQIHYLNSLCNQGGFMISKVAQFCFKGYQTVSITNDGTYLYIYVGAQNGGLYKIGTGRGGTVPGQIYLFQNTNKQEDVSWVYLKGRLYLRSSQKDVNYRAPPAFSPYTVSRPSP